MSKVLNENYFRLYILNSIPEDALQTRPVSRRSFTQDAKVAKIFTASPRF